MLSAVVDGDGDSGSKDDDHDAVALFIFFIQNVSDLKFIQNNIGAKIMRRIARLWPMRLYVRILIFHLSALLYENAVIACKHFSISCGAPSNKTKCGQENIRVWFCHLNVFFLSLETDVLYMRYHSPIWKKMAFNVCIFYLNDSNVSHILKNIYHEQFKLTYSSTFPSELDLIPMIENGNYEEWFILNGKKRRSVKYAFECTEIIINLYIHLGVW